MHKRRINQEKTALRPVIGSSGGPYQKHVGTSKNQPLTLSSQSFQAATPDFKWLYDVVVLLTELNKRASESAEQDQTARMCSLILLYTLRETNLTSRTAGHGSRARENILPLRSLWFETNDRVNFHSTVEIKYF